MSSRSIIEPDRQMDDDAKRLRACEACRVMKVRCERENSSTPGSCKRCAKTTRKCVVSVSIRGRRERTDKRVAGLEKKVHVLAARLSAVRSSSVDAIRQSELESEHSPVSLEKSSESESSQRGSTLSDTQFEIQANVSPRSVVGQKRKFPGSRYPSTNQLKSAPAPESGPSSESPRKRLDVFSSRSVSIQPLTLHSSNDYIDVIDRGIIKNSTATKIFNYYVNNMALHMPVVIFPSGTTVAKIRKLRPVLFLAVLCAASGTKYPEVQQILTAEIICMYADRILCRGEKSLELLQALHISALWYQPPEHSGQLTFYQLIHMAAVMAIEMGMGRNKRVPRSRNIVTELWRGQSLRRAFFPDPESMEARRAWLGCYFLCCNASMGLRRPNLIKWTPFMAECIEILETSAEALLSDRLLSQWVCNQHIAEEVGTQFSMEVPFASISFTDKNVQYALKGFERDLEHYISQVPEDMQTNTLKMAEHVVNLYMHEIVMHVDHNVDEFQPQFTETNLSGVEQPQSDLLTPAHISALAVCLSSVHGIFDIFISLEVDVIRTLPMFHFVRVSYAVVVLMKMFFTAASHHSELGKVINKDNMKVEYYLDGLRETFTAGAANGLSRTASKFVMMLTMLKSWFLEQNEERLITINNDVSSNDQMPAEADHHPNLADTSILPTSQQPHLYHKPKPVPSSPEYLSQARPEYEINSNSAGQIQNQQSLGSNMLDITQMDINGSASAINLHHAMGDGFGQAMGPTLGAGDFEQFFNNDDFFGTFGNYL